MGRRAEADDLGPGGGCDRRVAGDRVLLRADWLGHVPGVRNVGEVGAHGSGPAYD